VTFDNSPSDWDLKALIESWHAHLRSLIFEKKTDLPFERLCFQSQTDPRYSDIVGRWSKMNGEEKNEAWSTLLSLGQAGMGEMLPICVRCGVCCTRGSPTLVREDQEILSDEGIPWTSLLTLRKGEPAHSHLAGGAFYLPGERIKIREKPDSKTCALYDGENRACTVHSQKPVQCRAQSCWDPTEAEQQAAMPPLTREDILRGADVLLEIIAQHEGRCDFENFRLSFDRLKETKGESLGEILEMLAFDEHVREFAVEQVPVPEEVLDLVFGRSLVSRLHLFGFRVAIGEDGTRTLMPLTSDR
jgi:Fe-S-cluster containining protein